jgi:dockerin type I repeat protein
MNTGDTNTRHDGEEPQAPARLVAALKEPPARRVFVPPVIDESILNSARRHLAGPASSPGRFTVLRSWLWPGIATACLVLFGLNYFIGRSNRDVADVNRDGQVDILDAFQLARGVQRGEKSVSEMDLNGDGIVDQLDAEIIAARAVKLDKGGRS